MILMKKNKNKNILQLKYYNYFLNKNFNRIFEK